jgi:hypothetical protein
VLLLGNGSAALHELSSNASGAGAAASASKPSHNLLRSGNTGLVGPLDWVAVTEDSTSPELLQIGIGEQAIARLTASSKQAASKRTTQQNSTADNL